MPAFKPLQYNAFLKLKYITSLSKQIKYKFYHIDANSKAKFACNTSAQKKKTEYIKLGHIQKQAEGLKYGVQSSVPGCEKFKSLRFSLFRCKNAFEMLKIIHQRNKISDGEQFDISIYTVSMQSCFQSTHDYVESMKIWEYMRDENIIMPDIISYNTICNILCKCHQIDKALEIFESMKTEMNITPTLMTMTILISGCQYQNNILLAEELFDEVKNVYQLSPDSFTYNAMLTVYTKKNNMIDKAEELWNEIQLKVGAGHLTLDNILCNTMMNAFANVGNEHKMLHIKEFMMKHNLQLRIVEYTTMMKCYLKMDMPEKALNVYYKALLDTNVKISAHFVKCSTSIYLMFMEELLLENKNEIKQTVDECYDIIMNQFPLKYGQLTNDNDYFRLQFECVLLKSKYYNNNDIWLDKECIDIYHQMLEKNKIFGLNMVQYNNEEKYGIKRFDLHGCSEIHAIFSLRYIFLCLVEMKKEDLNHVRILCGRGSHSDPSITKIAKDSSKPPLHTIAEQELLSWTPPIRCSTWRKNNSYIELNIADVYDFLLENSKMLKSVLFS